MDTITPSTDKSHRLCPWCECWEPEHTARCWWVQARRALTPWGDVKR